MHRYHKLIISIGFLLSSCASLQAEPRAANQAIVKDNTRFKTFSFALIGDLPYTEEQEEKFENLMNTLNHQRKLEFIIHDGDFKGGSIPCDDQIYADRLTSFNQSKHPMVYVFGDNEWTDCHRAAAGEYNPFERLELMRDKFSNYSQPYSLGQKKLALKRQSEKFPENVRWVQGNVMFVGLHIPGSNNGLRTAEQYQAQANAEYELRNKANLEWLREAFELAEKNNHRGIMITIQANPWDFIPAERLTGYEDFLVLLEQKTRAFKKPVVLVHGDSHYFRIDKPLPAMLPSEALKSDFPFVMPWDSSKPRLENFTRVETFGHPNAHWVKVTVDRRNPNVFQFEAMIVEENRE